MFKVQPLRSKEVQKELADLLGVPCYDNTYAFFTVDLDEEGTKILSVIGMCQFEYSPDGAVIKSIAAAPDKKEDESVFIMVRTVMNFCYRAEIPTIAIEISENPNDLTSDLSFVRSLGFREKSGYVIDLKKFYRSPCHYNENENT
ncbi:MAG: hypothetical protein IKU40_11100 [Clostridia bacterium]|nr:hypothetical protein [Clostridia bacterium]